MNKSGNKKSIGSARQSCPVTDTCVQTAVTYMKLLKDKVGNYIKQKSRLERQKSTADKKAAKKSLFKSTLNRLVDASGGNASKPTCGGAASGSGVDQIKNLTNTLKECEAEIEDSCADLPPLNMTEVEGIIIFITN